jgi:hypothetical protein
MANETGAQGIQTWWFSRKGQNYKELNKECECQRNGNEKHGKIEIS